MIYGLYQSAAGMLVNEYRQDVLANNLANADTVGFKREIAVFAERDPASEAGRRDGPTADWLSALTGGIWLGETQTDFSAGNLVKTEEPLDVALEGPGFLVVSAEGQDQYTRDGRLTTTPTGQIVAATDGAPVLGVGNTPLFVNPVGGPTTIDQDGIVRQDGAALGQLALADFEDYRTLEKAGTGRFRAPDGAATVPARSRVLSGFVESSGVQPVQNMTEMIAASRAYTINARMLQLQDESAARVINLVARQ